MFAKLLALSCIAGVLAIPQDPRPTTGPDTKTMDIDLHNYWGATYSLEVPMDGSKVAVGKFVTLNIQTHTLIDVVIIRKGGSGDLVEKCKFIGEDGNEVHMTAVLPWLLIPSYEDGATRPHSIGSIQCEF